MLLILPSSIAIPINIEITDFAAEKELETVLRL